MAISAKDVKNLKELTNCGMMDCKRALEETNGDVDAAIKYLREKGLAKAAKKAGRIAAEGLVHVKVDETKKVGVVVEVNSETDFAAKSERFIELVDLITDAILANDVPDNDVAALKLIVPQGQTETIDEILTERIATLGENIQIRRFQKLTGDLHAYLHNGGGSIIGSIIEVSSDDNEAVRPAAKDLLLQITANAPQFVSRDEVPAAVLEAECEVQREIIRKENETAAKPKPANILEKIVEGRISTFVAEICLLDQEYVKDPSKKVAQFVKEFGHGLTVKRFVRYEKGEGIQKKEENFADEVASMVN